MGMGKPLVGGARYHDAGGEYSRDVNRGETITPNTKTSAAVCTRVEEGRCDVATEFEEVDGLDDGNRERHEQ